MNNFFSRLFKTRKQLASDDEINLRKQSIDQGRTHTERWAQSSAFEKNWSGRAVLAARMIADHRRVCDIGCGMQDLRKELEKDVLYLPMDIVKRTEDTLECEINSGYLPLDYIRNADVVTILGVIEYDLAPNFYPALSSLRRLIMPCWAGCAMALGA